MKYLFVLLSPLFLLAKVHYTKVEPYESITLKSAVSAQVSKVAIEKEGTTTNATVIQLDNKLDQTKLHSSNASLKLIQSMIQTNQDILDALSQSINKQQDYHQRISNMASASKTQTDNAFYTYINSRTQYLSTKEKIDSLKKQRLDLQYEVARLKDNLVKKNIKLKNKFLYKLLVNKGDFVNMGTPLAEVKDLSRAKLILFLESSELKNIKSKTIYIDDKATKLKISKVWKVTDEKFISSYRTEIIMKNPKSNFSKLLKIEFK